MAAVWQTDEVANRLISTLAVALRSQLLLQPLQSRLRSTASPGRGSQEFVNPPTSHFIKPLAFSLRRRCPKGGRGEKRASNLPSYCPSTLFRLTSFATIPQFRNGRAASLGDSLPRTPLLIGVRQRCIRHRRRLAPPPGEGKRFVVSSGLF